MGGLDSLHLHCIECGKDYILSKSSNIGATPIRENVSLTAKHLVVFSI
jgi:hypothetical protein